jgi:outer membrane receptor protein involved in Fe transport
MKFSNQTHHSQGRWVLNVKLWKFACIIAGGLFLFGEGSARLSAQSSTGEADQEIFELSPFTVDASDDTGYQATSTLAGTRIKTNLKDLGSSISVITSQFLEDTGATDAGSLLSYTSNTEVGGNQGNFSGAGDVDDGRYIPRDQRTNPQLNQRIRGLGRADLTRGFFLTDIAFDSYNTDRVTVSRGPNSLLFGIGSPGGVINNGTKKAVQGENFGEASIRLDNYGSVRSVLDLNRNLVDGRVALRLALLNDDAEFKQKPTWNRDERIYAALDVVLAKNEGSSVLDATILRLNGESGTSNGSPVETLPPSVAYHGWFQPIPASIEQLSGIAPPSNVIDPSQGGTWEFQTTFNPFAENAESGINTSVHPSMFREIGVVFPNHDATSPSYGDGGNLEGYQSLLTWKSNLDTLESTGIAGTPGVVAAYGNVPGDTPISGRTVEYHTNSPYTEAYATGFAVPTLRNPNVFDYRNKIYSGGIDRVSREFDAKNIALEQSFFDNKFAIEIAYDEQHYESLQNFFFTGGRGTSTTGPYDLYVSIAEYLQNGQPNPNLGRAYTRVNSPDIRFNEIDRETFRFTAFGEIDFAESDGWISRLGRHRLTGLYNDHRRNEHSTMLSTSWVSDDFDLESAVQGTTITKGRRKQDTIVYVSDSLLGLNSMDDVRLNQIQITPPRHGDTYRVQYADTSSAGAERTFRDGLVTVENYLNDENVSQNNIEAMAFAWQSYLFDDHIVGLLGYREDDTVSFARANEAEAGVGNRDTPDGRWNPDFTRLSATPSLEETGDTVTWSVIARYPEALLGELPNGMDFQFHYAGSENFNPIGLRNNALGQAIQQPTGVTEEYGFLIGFNENKVTLKANWFETSLENINAAPNINVATHARGRVNGYRDAELTGRTFDNQLITVNGDPASFPIQDYDTYYDLSLNAVPQELRDIVNYRQEDTDGDGVWDEIVIDPIPALASIQDRVAKGFELELVASPNQNWRIIGNISQQETLQSNTASVMSAILEEYNGNLQSARLGEMSRDGSGTVQTRSVNEIWLADQMGSMRTAKALDGTVSNEQREWRYTAVSTYDFNEGALKGAAIGGALRWESKAATGYLLTLEPESGAPIPDVTNPFFDDGLFSGDLWVSYKRRLFDKIDWKIQLNVRNAIGDDDDIPVKTNPDGQVAVIRMPNPRTIYLSNSFRF